jgi:hypothetical protein
MFDDPTIRGAIDVDPLYLDDSTSGFDFHPCSGMRSFAGHTGNDPVTFCNDVLYFTLKS